VDLHFFVSSVCHTLAMFLTWEGAMENGGGVCGGGALLSLVFATK
jgi:hypothetical protein